MGSVSAYKGRRVVENITWVIAAELLASARAMRFMTHRAGRGSGAAYRLICGQVPQVEGDSILYKDLQAVYKIIKNGGLVRTVEEAVGEMWPPSA